MATDPKASPHSHREHCGECGRETEHDVAVDIRTESDEDDEARFSREPYRTATCRVCGTATTQRMNNA